MAAKRFLITTLSIPYLLLAFICWKFRIKSITSDYKKCIDIIKENSNKEISPSLINTLRLAEDHRQLLHMGIDPIAISRTIYLRLFKKINQGASTIDQQLVRTITKRYEKTMRRKVREQILAILVRNASNPNDICKCYISCCYYGYSTYGIDELLNKKSDICEHGIIARIKYPFRKDFNIKTEEKYRQRVFYLIHLDKINSTESTFFLNK